MLFRSAVCTRTLGASAQLAREISSICSALTTINFHEHAARPCRHLRPAPAPPRSWQAVEELTTVAAAMTDTQAAAVRNAPCYEFEPLFLQVRLRRLHGWWYRHSQFVTAQVEDAVYCVNRVVFVKDSDFFRELFELPAESGRPVEGSSNEHPLRVEGIDKEDMLLFLHAMFPKCVLSFQPGYTSVRLTVPL